MFIDGRTLHDGQRLDTDVCIIGAGAAGITLAREFIDAPFRVALLESGGLFSDRSTQSLYRGSVTGHYYTPLDEVRLRYFGGSTNHWGGHCLPIRAMNFEKRPWIPHSGWPISYSQLKPHYERAQRIIGLGEYDYDAVRLARRLGKTLFPFDPAELQTVVARYHPTRFGQHYRDAIRNAANITTWLHSNVVSINLHHRKPVIRDVDVRTLEGNTWNLRARQFLLATGGIENPRLLLLSDRARSRGLGNEHDLVGRFFMEHIWYQSGEIIPLDQRGAHVLYTRMQPLDDDVTIKAHLVMSDEVLRRERMPDFRAEFGLRRDMIATRTENDIAPLVNDAMHILSGKTRGRGATTGVLKYLIGNYAEQVPNPDSRVTLARERDALGCRRAALHWQLSELDLHGLQQAQRVMAREVGRTGFGRMRVAELNETTELLESAHGGAHHMGTTRMGDDPKTSVVNADCRVHDLDNLYVAGSSVFPSGGFANPTLTIIALALRLADEIRQRMRA